MLSFDPVPFDYQHAILGWLGVVAVFAAVAVLTFLATSIVTFGARGPWVLAGQVGEFFSDWFRTSPRRVLAVAKLTLLEGVRRKVLYVFVVFAILYLFAGWFMTGVGAEADFALRVYVAFVLRSISWPIMVVMIFLACWGLPEDIRLRSLHTVVTKPIYKHEIVLGRIIGYSSIGLGVLAIMATVGYIWMLRGLPPAARVQLEAKVPIYGKMAFRDREGNIVEKGINVGDENEFRSFIDANTKATAIWDFQNPSWANLQNDEELIVGGRIHPGDEFILEYPQRDKKGPKFSVAAKSESAADVANAIAAAWNQAEGPFSKVTAEARGNVVRLTRKSPPDGSLAVAVSVKRATDDKAGPEFKGRGILLESHFQAFRTWKGNIEVGVLCQLTVVNEYGVLTLPEQLPQGNLKLGTLSIPVQAGPAATAAPALATAISNARFGTSERPLAIIAKVEAGQPTRIILRGPPNDVLPALKTDTPGFGYRYVRIEAPIERFEIREFRRNEVVLRRAQQDRDYKSLDLFQDLLPEGRLRVEARCRSGGQLLGAARPDLLVRLPSHPFIETYFKACLGIAMMLVMIVVLGVCGSTFVKGPVGLLLTITYLSLGTFVRPFLEWMFSAQGKDWVGGGAFEGTYRVLFHLNPNTPIARSLGISIAEALDTPFNRLLSVLYRYVVPDFRVFNMDEYVANAFDIPWGNAVLPCVVTLVGVAIPWIILGHFALKMRELEHK